MTGSTQSVTMGILAIIAGLVFCFRGYGALRVVIPVWAAIAGFYLGAGLVASNDDGRYLTSTTGWIVGIVIGLLFGALAYAYYAVAVIISMAAAGFAVGSSVVAAVGVSWNWVIVLAGVAVGVALAALAIIANLPMVLLVVVSAVAGASAIIFGVLVVSGAIGTGPINSADVNAQLSDRWWLYVAYVVLAAVGIASQLRAAHAHGNVRDGWDAQGRARQG
ncbi:uncharacterized protein DUF4203 [Antricoccus suffuscus]|uniref:Uncharacterized protein DUF4203 n=1 Tax=Antricoccus suffuscus TaxID=1629062 RepID=A0A2T1A667_9ACTN|nr:DUF4203 domain-containing protein [Antricoccus suffuscus]PRZ44090.1 uncharacterized protein DUF4203 [Antricoccus suffuscus]